MRLAALGLIAVAAALSACAPLIMVDPQDAAERDGRRRGARHGAGHRARRHLCDQPGDRRGDRRREPARRSAASPGSSPRRRCRPTIRSPCRLEAVIPHFYDSWPPGYHAPPGNSETQPPPAG